jgi:hypothetical protein
MNWCYATSRHSNIDIDDDIANTCTLSGFDGLRRINSDASNNVGRVGCLSDPSESVNIENRVCEKEVCSDASFNHADDFTWRSTGERVVAKIGLPSRESGALVCLHMWPQR